MNKNLINALIIIAVLVVIYWWFSPRQDCIRYHMDEIGASRGQAAIFCMESTSW